MMKQKIVIWFGVAGLLGSVLFNGAAFAAGKFTIGHSGGHTDEHGTPFGAPGDPHKVDRTIEVIMTYNEYNIPELSVKPGQTGVLIWKFKKVVSLQFVCNVPDNYQSSMVGEVTFVP
jgi:uncharacterized cupredoxin-like copper-binding protein